MKIKFNGVIEIETADVVEVLKPFIKPIMIPVETKIEPPKPEPKPEPKPDPAERLRETMEAEQKVEKPQTGITRQQALDACNATKKEKGLPAVVKAINDVQCAYFDDIPQDRYADLLKALKNG